MIRAVAVAALCLALAGCSKREPEAGPSAPASSQPSAPPVEPVTSPSTLPPTDLSTTPMGALNLAERFAKEARERPTGAVRAEDAFEAFKAAGATFEPPRQHLASFFKAQYCVGAIHRPEDFAIDVCEYRDAKAAREGKASSEKSLAAVRGRQLHLNGATMLTLRLGKDTPENQALAKKLVEAFAKLTPPKGDAGK